MKLTKINIGIFLIFFCSIAKGQLLNTKWSGVMNVPDERNIILNFKQDTLCLISTEDRKIIEVMTYKSSSDVINLVKVNGESPCDVGFKASLRYSVFKGLMTITVIDAECNGWANAWPNKPFKKE